MPPAASRNSPQTTPRAGSSMERADNYAQPPSQDPGHWDSDTPVHDEVPLAADHQGHYPDANSHHGEQYDERMEQDARDADYEYQDDVPIDPTKRSCTTTRRAYAPAQRSRHRPCPRRLRHARHRGRYGYRSYFGFARFDAAAAGDHGGQFDAEQDRARHCGRRPVRQGRAGPTGRHRTAGTEAGGAGRAQAAGTAAGTPRHTSASRGRTGAEWLRPASARRTRSAAASRASPKRSAPIPIRPDGADASGRPHRHPVSRAAVARRRRGRCAASGHHARPPAPRRASRRSASRTGGRAAASAGADRDAPPAPRAEESQLRRVGFVVQLSSQKTEAEAQASFRSLQAKFPNELGNRQPLIRRADLGAKGVFYRTLVGPFASAQEASQFCANYKAAGGQCVVPNN